MSRTAFFTLIILSFTQFVFGHCAAYNLDEKIREGSTKGTGGITSTGPTTPGSTPVTRVYLFSTLTQTDGNFGARAGADALCQTARNAAVFPENQCNKVRAFVSISGTDEIVDLASNYGLPTGLPFNTPNNTLLANNQADLLDGAINSTLAAAGITLAAGWYSFSGTGTGDGTLDGSANCTGGTSTGSNGRYGQDNNTSTGWMSLTQAVCTTPRHLLCVCF